MEKYLRETAKIYKAFCDENRLYILELLTEGEHCACELLEKLRISQSTLSHHMKILTDAQVVQGRRDGKWMYYTIDKEGIRKAQRLLETFTEVKNRKADCR